MRNLGDLAFDSIDEMKRTLFALLAALATAASFNAAAEGTLFQVENKADGYIHLTDWQMKCPQGKWHVFATSSGRVGSTGCWSSNDDDETIEVTWSHGGQSVIPMNALSVTAYAKRKRAAREQQL